MNQELDNLEILHKIKDIYDATMVQNPNFSAHNKLTTKVSLPNLTFKDFCLIEDKKLTTFWLTSGSKFL